MIIGIGVFTNVIPTLKYARNYQFDFYHFRNVIYASSKLVSLAETIYMATTMILFHIFLA